MRYGFFCFFFFQAEDGIRDVAVTGVQTCALPIWERRHFPAINWLTSYSLYSPILEDWYRKNVADDWNQVRLWAMETLQKKSELQEIVQLVGSDALPEEERLPPDGA